MQIFAIICRGETGQKAEGPTIGHTGSRTAGAGIELGTASDYWTTAGATAWAIDAAVGGCPTFDGAAIKLTTTDVLGVDHVWILPVRVQA